jgi:membrane-bound lytic murein transglycosylase A
MRFFSKLVILSMVFACSRMGPKSRDESMRVTDRDVNLENLVISEEFKDRLDGSILALRNRSSKVLQFGQCKVNSSEYADHLELSFAKSKSIEELKAAIKRDFTWYEVFGRDKWGEVLLTSYYSPVINGRKKIEGPFTYPLFSIPEDLVEVEMKSFVEKDLMNEAKVRTKISGRVKKGWNGIDRIVPYHSRLEIDKELSLVSKKAKVLAYVNPIEAFFFHIQGSGVIRLKSGELLSLGYAAQNGHRYHSIGKLLYDRIPKEEMTKAKIEEYLRTLTTEELFEFLGSNPSYVFFKVLKKGLGRTTYGPEVIERGTIAVDPSMISLGSLALLEYETPLFSNEKQTEPDQFSIEARPVWAHDTGGAIKSAGRADLYWGRGLQAGQAAGVINQRGKLWVLAPKACRNSN